MTSISVSKWENLDKDENLFDLELKPEKTSFFVGSQEISWKNIRFKFKSLDFLRFQGRLDWLFSIATKTNGLLLIYSSKLYE